MISAMTRGCLIRDSGKWRIRQKIRMMLAYIVFLSVRVT